MFDIVDGELIKLEHNKCINNKFMTQDVPPALPFNNVKICIKTESITEDEPLEVLPIIKNEVYDESNIDSDIGIFIFINIIDEHNFF